MFQQPPKKFGKFKQIRPEHYDDLHKVLQTLLPRSRLILSTLQLTMKGIEQPVAKFFKNLNLMEALLTILSSFKV